MVEPAEYQTVLWLLVWMTSPKKRLCATGSLAASGKIGARSGEGDLYRTDICIRKEKPGNTLDFPYHL